MLLDSSSAFLELKNRIENGFPQVRVDGVTGTALCYLFSRFIAEFKRHCLVILPDSKEAADFFRNLAFFMSVSGNDSNPEEIRLVEFPPYDISPLTGLSPHRDLVARRIQSLYAMLSYKSSVVVTSIDALSFKILPKKVFVRSMEYLETGEDVDRDSFIKKLESCGYQRVSLVEERGDYTIRGGVMDLFSPMHPFPVRLEFWGDRLESIRQFDPASQRSQDHLQELVVLPSVEIIMDEDGISKARSMGRLPVHPGEGTFPGQEAWLMHFYSQLDTLFQYLPKDSLITIIDPYRVESAYVRTKKKFEKDVARFRKEAAEKVAPFPETEGLFAPFDEIAHSINSFQRLELGAGRTDLEDKKGKTIHFEGSFRLDYDVETTLGSKGKVSMAPLAKKISEWISLRARVVFVTRTRQQASRLEEILENYGITVDGLTESWGQLPDKPGLFLCLGHLLKGFVWPDIGLFVVSENEIFGVRKGRDRARRKTKGKPISWSSFSQLKDGDFVVHEEHGIGRYSGLVKMEIENRINDFVIIDYANNDRLYIPADRISILQKYAGADEKEPKLAQLGGRAWDIAKQKAKKSVRRIAKQLVELYALRQHKKGYAFSEPDHVFREFEASFEHDETDDQIRAVEDVLKDMASERPMDRLICGDVGFGKTEVALRAAFKAVADGKQVAMVVPTTVLAEQHYVTFKKRFAPYSKRVEVLSRFKSREEQSRTLKELQSGKVDIIIGTHRLLQKDVKFTDLGLMIIDEEHRFGVRQKEALKKLRALVDVLAITATPIPRTLHMSMMGVRDLSVIETPPEDRLSIQTQLLPYDESLIKRAIQFELERGGQVFFVHNRVKDIDHVADRLRQIVPQARFAIAHGQMKEKELEETMIRFFDRKVDVLVSTTIIESGLDIPSANTIIINEADRLGLAQIYQLRGRVGRSKEKAYAYLLIGSGSRLTKDAERRLKALMEFSHLGAGLNLAMHDLKIRGGGNILGFAQSGQISAVGYELYVKLIERAVAELKGEEWHDDINPEININIPAYLPSDYVIDTDVRLNIYRRLSSLIEISELEAMEEEIRDRFGPLPQEVSNLLGVMSVRIILKELGISRLDVGTNSLALTFGGNGNLDPKKMAQLVSTDPVRFRFLSGDRLKIHTGPLLPQEDFDKIRKNIEMLKCAQLTGGDLDIQRLTG